ncbi:MAG TPA: ATP-binding protein [Thermoflexia bacterium]|nr:ATP-binding protein [Thermoflexia bacterium]
MTILSPTSRPSIDLEVLDNGLVFTENQDKLDYFWFDLVEREAGREYYLHRVVRLEMLRYLPQEARQDAGLLDTMRSALTGLYNQRRADYDPCVLTAGIFDPPLGVIQCYGVVGVGQGREQALHNANLGIGAVEGVMANFAQSRFESLDIQKAEWLHRSFLEMPYSLVAIGQPDPRQSARGMGREGPGEAQKSATMAGESAYTMQQNEMLFRALSRLEEEFLFLILASRVAPRDLATMLEGIASEASIPASRQSGAKSISFGLAFPLAASGNLGQSVGTSFGRNEGQSLSEGLAESEATSHSEGHASTVGHAVSDGTAHTVGTAHTTGVSSSTSTSLAEGTSHSVGSSAGIADSVGTADSVGSADTVGSANTVGSSQTVGHATTAGGFASGSSGGSASTSLGHSNTHTEGAQSGMSWGGGSAHSDGYSSGSGEAHSYQHNVGVSGRVGVGVVGGGYQEGVAEGATYSDTYADSNADTASSNWGASAGNSEANSFGSSVGATAGSSWGASSGSSQSVSSSVAQSTSQAHTASQSHSTSQGHTDSRAHSASASHSVSQGASASDGVSSSVGHSSSNSSFASTTHSVADTVSHSETSSWSNTESVSDGASRGISRSRAVGRTSGTNVGRAMGIARSMGMSAAVVPSVSAAKSYQWQDDKAIQLTGLLRAQEELLRQATLEGAYLTDAYMLCRTERGAAAAEVAIRQAFHGSELPVVTPVQTRRLTDEEQAYIRLHALAFTPSTREERIAGALEAYKDSTMLLPLQLAAYTAPGLFEEGAAVTTQERTPAFAFVPGCLQPHMPGDVVLAHLYSTETGRLTSAPLRLSEDRMFHTAFVADTGFGKTVAAERMAVETTRLWKYRTVVFDFGAGWRRLLNADLGEPERVEVYQVFPGATAPLRWNPLQIGKRTNPEQQMRATCELIRNAGQMGPRQLGFMRRALKTAYIDHGVLTSFREVLSDEKWSVVRDDEWDVLDAARAEWGQDRIQRKSLFPLVELEQPFERQAIAVHRSKQVDLVMWHEELLKIFSTLRAGTPDHTSLEGVLLRVEPFAEGAMEQMYGRGEGSIAFEELGMLGPADDPWGISILEGGAEMDEFAKAVIFSLGGWHLYHDAVVRRRRNIGRGPQRKLQIFFEEANKVLSGVAADMGEQPAAAGGGTSEIWRTMWRDGRKYGIWLHVIAQTVSELPKGIMSSCNNAFYSQTKEARDRDAVMAHLAFSEKGFTDEDYKRYISRMPQKLAICKLGYSDDVMHTTPFLCRPVMVAAREPTEEELVALYKQRTEMAR